MISSFKLLLQYFPYIFAQRMFVFIILLILLYFFLSKVEVIQNKRISLLFGEAYLAFVLFITIIGRCPRNYYEYSLIPFASYARLISDGSLVDLFQIIANIFMLMPLTVLVLISIKYKRIFCIKVILFLPIFIEITQFVLKIGMFEVDDLMNNCLGVIIVYEIWNKRINV